MSEAQKYQGTLYKEKPNKHGKTSVKAEETPALVPRKAYVEDAPDPDTGDALTIVDPPPEAPSPPDARPTRPAEPVNVFDFLVTEDTPNASKVSLGGSKEQMQMVADAPSVFEAGLQVASESDDDHEYDEAFKEHGYSYGAEPITTKKRPKQIEYQTPAPKSLQNGSNETIYELDGANSRSTDKKRKRNHVEELDIAAIRQSQERDEVMADAPAVLHSGLTGGLGRLLSRSKFPPSPEYSGNEPGTLSPAKRSRAIITKERGRNGTSALVRFRKGSSSRRASDESRPRKHHRSHHHSTNGDDHQSERPKRKLRTIEYHPHQDNDSQQLVVYRTRAELFLSFVTKGPESESGYSMNKALKRYHREREEQGVGMGKAEEEKQLWKSLRLRKNERGEVVLLI